MKAKFVTLCHHCGDILSAPDFDWDYAVSKYIEILLSKDFPHASLSGGVFSAYFWKWGNTEWLGIFPGLSKSKLDLHHEYLRRGGGLVFYEAGYALPPGYDFNPGVRLGDSIESIINGVCRRLTVRKHPFTGVEEPELAAGRLYGIDAMHSYFGDLGEDGKKVAVINGMSLLDWLGYYLCGVERGEYAGPDPMQPHMLDTNWLDIYQNEFKETPFYWITGIQCLLHYKSKNTDTNQLQQFWVDQAQRIWNSKTPAQRAAFALDWLCTSGDITPYRGATFFMSKGLGYWKDLYQISTGINSKNAKWRDFQIPTNNVPRAAISLQESHLLQELIGTVDQRYGLFQEKYAELIDTLKTFRETHENVFYCSDDESKQYVIQQYHADLPTVDHQRIIAIATYLANTNPLTTAWQLSENEWQCDPSISVTRPPNYAEIEIDGEKEYYTLAESWWIMLYALYLIATNDGLTEIPDIPLRLVLGPSEPAILTEVNSEDLPPDSMLRINVWWQHNEFNNERIVFNEIKKQVRQLFLVARSQPVGPTYPTNRQVVLPKVVTFWPFAGDGSITIVGNAAETLYIMAQALVNWDLNPTEPEHLHFLPSHVLAKIFYTYGKNGLLPSYDCFNPTSLNLQKLWLSLGQQWTFKPAVLKTAYR